MDDEILKELDIPKSMLPQAKPSSEIYGETDPPFSAAGSPLQEQREISRQHCLDRLVLKKEKPKIHTVRDVFF